MKLLWVMIISLSCSHASDVKINLYAKKILDIELPAKSVLPYCTIPGDPEKKNSWLGIYIFYHNRIEWLAERRQRLPKDCLKYKTEMVKLLKKSLRARVIGIESAGGGKDDDLVIVTGNPKLTSIDEHWMFSRMITDVGCFGPDKGCDEPRLIEMDRYENIYE